MVIHDMRNPTNSIEFAMKEILKMVEQAVKMGEFQSNQTPNQIGPGHDFSYPQELSTGLNFIRAKGAANVQSQRFKNVLSSQHDAIRMSQGGHQQHTLQTSTGTGGLAKFANPHINLRNIHTHLRNKTSQNHQSIASSALAQGGGMQVTTSSQNTDFSSQFANLGFQVPNPYSILQQNCNDLQSQRIDEARETESNKSNLPSSNTPERGPSQSASQPSRYDASLSPIGRNISIDRGPSKIDANMQSLNIYPIKTEQPEIKHLSQQNERVSMMLSAQKGVEVNECQDDEELAADFDENVASLDIRELRIAEPFHKGLSMKPDRRGKKLLDESRNGDPLLPGSLIKGFGQSDLSNITSRDENEERQSVLYQRTKMSIIKSIKYDPNEIIKMIPTEELNGKFVIQNSGIILNSDFDNFNDISRPNNLTQNQERSFSTSQNRVSQKEEVKSQLVNLILDEANNRKTLNIHRNNSAKPGTNNPLSKSKNQKISLERSLAEAVTFQHVPAPVNDSPSQGPQNAVTFGVGLRNRSKLTVHRQAPVIEEVLNSSEERKSELQKIASFEEDQRGVICTTAQENPKKRRRRTPSRHHSRKGYNVQSEIQLTKKDVLLNLQQCKPPADYTIPLKGIDEQDDSHVSQKSFNKSEWNYARQHNYQQRLEKAAGNQGRRRSVQHHIRPVGVQRVIERDRRMSMRKSTQSKVSQQVKQQVPFTVSPVNSQPPAFILTEVVKKQCETWLKNSLFSSTMLLNLINDLLDLAKIENSQFNFNTTQFNLHEIIQKAVDTLQFQATQKGINLEYVMDEGNIGNFMEIQGDDNRYLQILLNFLSNSLKFTPQNGSVKIEIKLLEAQPILTKEIQALTASNVANMKSNLNEFPSPSAAGKFQMRSSKSLTRIPKGTVMARTSSMLKLPEKNQPELSIEDFVRKAGKSPTANGGKIEKYLKFQLRIADTGQGISPENLSKLFMNFGKLEEHAAGNKTGTGLGLSICKTLIEMMGGSVQVESEVGKGTCFIINLQTKGVTQNLKKALKWQRSFLVKTNKLDPQSLLEPENQGPYGVVNSMGVHNLRSALSIISTPTLRLAKQNMMTHTPKNAAGRRYSAFTFHNSDSRNANIGLVPALGELNDVNSGQQNARFHNQSSNQTFLPIKQANGQLQPQSQSSPNNKQDGLFNYNDGMFHIMKNEEATFPNEELSLTFKDGQQFFGRNENANLGGRQQRQMQQQQDSAVHKLFTCDFNEPRFMVPQRKYRALVANDDLFQLSIICLLLRNSGFEVEEAENGLVAVQKYNQAQQANQDSSYRVFDVVILDLDMPIMNGYEACQRLRSNKKGADLQQLFHYDHGAGHKTEAIHPRMLIVALSALITDSMKDRLHECGFDYYIDAPITEAKIKDIIIFNIQSLEQAFLMQQQQQQELDQSSYENNDMELQQQKLFKRMNNGNQGRQRGYTEDYYMEEDEDAIEEDELGNDDSENSYNNNNNNTGSRNAGFAADTLFFNNIQQESNSASNHNNHQSVPSQLMNNNTFLQEFDAVEEEPSLWNEMDETPRKGDRIQNHENFYSFKAEVQSALNFSPQRK
ncbi:hypothetical protein FGO68_gene11703 [Halteria grandinella]|uniref:histidine kinase n=1 Tax=Halteria grandinella TaxID=5974 RepID=A0A8J8P861_HALGN|nr:hypothetical protein FGO68_gene11703 [Halteria grandinella]